MRSAAEDECRKALERGEGDEPLPARIAKAVSAMSKLGVSIERIEAQYGASAKWTPVELANLQIAYRSIRNNETSADEAFPRVGTQEVTDQLRQLAGQRSTDEASDEQGRTDEQRGDQHGGTDDAGQDDTPAWKSAVDAHLERLKRAEFLADANKAVDDFSASKGALPDDVRADVEAAEQKAMMRFNPAVAG